MASYAGEVASIHKQFNTVLNCYWKHKAQHERLLKKHLKEEMAQVKKIKARIKYR